MIIKDFKLESKNRYNINCDLYIPENAKKIVIAIHGFGGDKNSSVIVALAKELNKQDIGVISFDFPGHGNSEVNGDMFTVENSIEDLANVEEYARNEFNKPIGLFATSYGAYIALLHIEKNKAKYEGIVLRCPALNMRKIFSDNILNISLEEFKRQGYCNLGYERKIDISYEYYEQLVNNNIEDRIKEISNSILIIHGTEDNMAPIEDSIKFQEKFKDNVKLEKIYGADHRFKKEGEIERIIELSKGYFNSEF